ncbi:MAG: DUF1015 domain-containing protein [Thermodesulfovibrionales bacterium]|nr:DUF1015 domain-containing protein [Thermodesulfovibrionales bacterium]
MASIQPFKGIYYNIEKVNPDDVVAPPYDIITSEMREFLYRSPYNIVRVDFGKDLPGDSEFYNKYTRARNDLYRWIEDQILLRDERPYFYVYEVEYTILGKKRKLRGIIALVKLEELGRGVYPHEATYSKPKADRLNLMRFCNGNISPIYALYNSPEGITSKIIQTLETPPFITALDNHAFVHKLYRVEDFSLYGRIINEFKDKAVYIADGHHRYEVALDFKREMHQIQKETKNMGILNPYDYVMMFLANIQDEGISILPTHRLVKGISNSIDLIKKIENYFDVSTLGLEKDIIENLSYQGKNAIGLYVKNDEKWYILKYNGKVCESIHPAQRDLDVVLLHELIFKLSLGISEFGYEMNPEEALRMVKASQYDAVFFLNPPSLEDVEKSALANVRMPPKSTYFFPKLLTGLIINSFYP